MDTAPADIIAEEQPFVDRVAVKVHQLAAVKPALVRLLEWRFDHALELTEQQRALRPTLTGGRTPRLAAVPRNHSFGSPLRQGTNAITTPTKTIIATTPTTTTPASESDHGSKGI